MTSGSGRRRSISVLIYASGTRPDGWQCGILVGDGLVVHNLLASAAYERATAVPYSSNSCQSCLKACKWCTNCLSGRVNYSYWFIEASTLRIADTSRRCDLLNWHRRYWRSRRNIDINGLTDLKISAVNASHAVSRQQCTVRGLGQL